LCEFIDFHRGAAEVSDLLICCVASLSDWCTYFETVSRVECQLKNEDETNSLPRNIGQQSPGDAAKYSIRPETQAKWIPFLSQSTRFVGIHNIEI